MSKHDPDDIVRFRRHARPAPSIAGAATRPLAAAGVIRFLPLVLLAATPLVVWLCLPLLGWHTLDWNTLAQHRDFALAWVERHPLVAPLLYIAAYALTTMLSLPHGVVQTLAGGLLFGAVYGCVLTVAGASAGATLLLLIVRSAFGHLVLRQRSNAGEIIRRRLARDGFLYLLALRLLPLVPFWVVNLAAALAGLRLRVFIPATVIGIAPASYILSSLGASFGAILAAGRTPDVSVLFAPRVLLPLSALSALALLAAVLRRAPDAHA